MEPDELRYKEFRRSVRGYSPDEVDDLLDAVADELDAVRGEQARLTAELDEARATIQQYESLEGSIRATLVQAEKAASDYQEAARREAEVIIHDAETSARERLADSSDKVERVHSSYEALRETRSRLDTELRQLLEGYLQSLDDSNASVAREIEVPLEESLDTEAITEAREAADQERQEQRQGTEQVETEREAGQEPRSQSSDETAEEVGEAGDSGDGSSKAREPGLEEGVEEGPRAEEPGDGADTLSEENGDPRRGRFLRRRG
ncbi:DivIVA domain-containing protein [Rubrobacter aplysinae]|uniref:DivIVA domain-containing protein n=1 Tax=Rubrobacter aplysinae TaxID=909625 RepID=UPI00064BF1AC|nr:DivIVA domain-containing protein [Rubrobacter aplysinae]